jgi:hypothetical protein
MAARRHGIATSGAAGPRQVAEVSREAARPAAEQLGLW